MWLPGVLGGYHFLGKVVDNTRRSTASSNRIAVVASGYQACTQLNWLEAECACFNYELPSDVVSRLETVLHGDSPQNNYLQLV